MHATVTKLNWVKDENGKHVYDNAALTAFSSKMTKQAKRQNKKIAKAHAEGRLLSFSIIDPIAYAESMVKIYGHQFRAYTEEVVK